MLVEADVEDMAPESSAGVEQGDTSQTSPAESPAATDEAEKGTLDVVRDAIDKSKPDEAAESSAAGDEAGEEPGDKALTESEEAALPYYKDPRFQRVIKERQRWKHTAQANEGDAKLYRNVQSFLSQQGISAEEAADALTLAALVKSNPVEAWKRLQPVAQQLAISAGLVLPADLKQRVDKQEITREVALEISKARATATAVETSRSFEQQQRERTQQTELQNSLYARANEWEAHRRARDPNFDAKLPRLREKIAYLHATEGKPNTPEGVTEQLKRAYQAVNAEIPAAMPNPQAQRRPAVRPVNGGQVAGQQRPAANSTLDVINQVAAAHGR